MKRLAVLLLAVGAGCAGRTGVVLTPEINPSFAHVGGGRICLVGADWAIEAHFDRGFPEQGEATLAPSHCLFYRGRGISKHFMPGAGPLNQLAIERHALPKSEVMGLQVTGSADGRSASDGTGRFSFSAFRVDGVDYAPIGPLTLDIRGPFP